MSRDTNPVALGKAHWVCISVPAMPQAIGQHSACGMAQSSIDFGLPFGQKSFTQIVLWRDVPNGYGKNAQSISRGKYDPAKKLIALVN
ncbi:MAG: hypothetical protein JNM09_03520 [Blastocatellia bacterium]|nr:hypothetical protein [Blastocatellia bacterium]